MDVDRSAEACGACHRRGAVESINASGGFARGRRAAATGRRDSGDFACKSCHRPDGTASERTSEELVEEAVDYHARP